MLFRVLNIRSNITAFYAVTLLLEKNFRLILEMSKNDLTGRYKGQLFGSVWIFAHPLALTLMYLFIFGVVFKQKMGGSYELPLDYTIYILSGLIPWLTFQNSMSLSVSSIISNSLIVKQFTFPIETLPIKDVFISSVTWFVGMGATLVYIISSGQHVSITWLLLPIVFIFQLIAMIGISLILSSAAVFFRDIKDFVGLYCLVAIFLMPVVYLPDWVPSTFQSVILVNPFTYMTYVYQDVIYFGRIEHPSSWFIFFLESIFILIIGYRFFQKTKPLFGSLL